MTLPKMTRLRKGPRRWGPAKKAEDTKTTPPRCARHAASALRQGPLTLWRLGYPQACWSSTWLAVPANMSDIFGTAEDAHRPPSHPALADSFWDIVADAVGSAVRRLMPRWLAKAGAACFGCFSPARRPADDRAAKIATPPAAAKPQGLAAAADDFAAPPMHVVVPRTTWSAAAAVAAAQVASQGEAPSSEFPGVPVTHETSSANLLPNATTAESAASPLETQPPADNPCRALMPYAAPMHLRGQCEHSTRAPSGGCGSGNLTVKLLINLSAVRRAEVIPLVALCRVAVLPGLAALDSAAESVAKRRQQPPSCESSTAPATQCMMSDDISGHGAASTGARYNQCTTMIIYPVCVIMACRHTSTCQWCAGVPTHCCISVTPWCTMVTF